MLAAEYAGWDDLPLEPRVSVLLKGWREPIFAGRGLGVGEDAELSHDRHDGELGGFSGFDHGLAFGLEFRGSIG
jgi:hypothetical protein